MVGNSSDTNYIDSIILNDPDIQSVMDHIRFHFEDLVTGKKSRIIILLRGMDRISEHSAKATQLLIINLGFVLVASTARYVQLERRFRLPLEGF